VGREPVPALGTLQFELVGGGSGDGICDDRGGEYGHDDGDDGDNGGRTARTAAGRRGQRARRRAWWPRKAPLGRELS
jgi:hypothetical protein